MPLFLFLYPRYDGPGGASMPPVVEMLNIRMRAKSKPLNLRRSAPA